MTKRISKTLSIVWLLGNRPEMVFLVEMENGYRNFYTVDGYPFVNLTDEYQVQEPLGAFSTWEGFESLAGIELIFCIDVCPHCEQPMLTKRHSQENRCGECRRAAESVNEMAN